MASSMAWKFSVLNLRVSFSVCRSTQSGVAVQPTYGQGLPVPEHRGAGNSRQAQIVGKDMARVLPRKRMTTSESQKVHAITSADSVYVIVPSPRIGTVEGISRTIAARP
jgi:hypothetical protein